MAHDDPLPAPETLRARIAHRRNAHDDPALERLPDDNLGVIVYLAHHQRGLDTSVLGADAVDGLWLLRHIRRDTDKATLALIALAEKSGVSLATLAPALGVKGRAGVWALKKRLSEHLHGSGARDEKLAVRRHAADVRRRTWLAAHAGAVFAVAQVLVDNVGEFEDEEVVSSLEEVGAELAVSLSRPTSGLLYWLWIVVAEIEENDIPTHLSETVKMGRKLRTQWHRMERTS